MNHSESIKELATALAKAQAVMTGAKKDVSNTFFKSKYADLASCWEAARSALPQNGLCVIQTTRTSEKDEVIVCTRLAHSSGEWIEGELSMPVSKADAQGYGSALTYARRYGLCAIVGIAPEEDDGNAAVQAKPKVIGAVTGAELNKEAFDALGEEAQAYIQRYAVAVIDLYETGGDVLGYLSAHTLDSDEKMALWSLLPSKIRSAIKKAQTEARAA